MRVSDGMRMDAMTHNLSNLESRQLDASQVASTGQRLSHISDDPIAAAQIVRIQGAMASSDAYKASIRNAQTDLEATESTLSSMGDLFVRLREIALQGANGTQSAEDRAQMAQEVSQIQEQFIAFGNTRGTQGYLFAGSQLDTEPFDSDGNFSGDDATRTTEIGSGLSAEVTVSGSIAFSFAGGREVFADIAALKEALASSDQQAIAASVNALDASQRQLLAARLDAGAKLSRLDTANSAQDQAQQVLSSQQHAVGDADAAAAYSRLIAIQQSIQQAISVARTTLSSMALNRFG